MLCRQRIPKFEIIQWCSNVTSPLPILCAPRTLKVEAQSNFFLFYYCHAVIGCIEDIVALKHNFKEAVSKET